MSGTCYVNFEPITVLLIRSIKMRNHEKFTKLSVLLLLSERAAVFPKWWNAIRLLPLEECGQETNCLLVHGVHCGVYHTIGSVSFTSPTVLLHINWYRVPLLPYTTNWLMQMDAITCVLEAVSLLYVRIACIWFTVLIVHTRNAHHLDLAKYWNTTPNCPPTMRSWKWFNQDQKTNKN